MKRILYPFALDILDPGTLDQVHHSYGKYRLSTTMIPLGPLLIS